MSNETTLDDVLGLVASVGDREIELDAGDSPTCLFIGADEVHCFDRPDLAEMLATLLPYLRAHGDELRAALEDARRYAFVRDNWHSLCTATGINGRGEYAVTEIFIGVGEHTPYAPGSLDAAIDAAQEVGK